MILRRRQLLVTEENKFNSLTELQDLDDEDVNNASIVRSSKVRRKDIETSTPNFVVVDGNENTSLQRRPSVNLRRKILAIAYEKLR